MKMFKDELEKARMFQQLFPAEDLLVNLESKDPSNLSKIIHKDNVQFKTIKGILSLYLPPELQGVLQKVQSESFLEVPQSMGKIIANYPGLAVRYLAQNIETVQDWLFLKYYLEYFPLDRPSDTYKKILSFNPNVIREVKDYQIPENPVIEKIYKHFLPEDTLRTQNRQDYSFHFLDLNEDLRWACEDKEGRMYFQGSESLTSLFQSINPERQSICLAYILVKNYFRSQEAFKDIELNEHLAASFHGEVFDYHNVEYLEIESKVLNPELVAQMLKYGFILKNGTLLFSCEGGF